MARSCGGCPTASARRASSSPASTALASCCSIRPRSSPTSCGCAARPSRRRQSSRSSRASRRHGGKNREFTSLPLLERRHLQEHYEEVKSTRLPRAHGRTAESRTSGSTGAPVRVLKTELSQLFWRAFTLREHAWHARDFGGRLAVIRHGLKGGEQKNWGPATSGLIATGPAAGLNIRTEVGEQLDWLGAST